jgi:hypothetical protein
MALRCRACGRAFPVGEPYCPACTGTDVEREDEDVGKISKAGGPSIAGEPKPAATTAVEVPADGSLSEPIEGDGSGEALPEIAGRREAPDGEGSARALPRPGDDALKIDWVDYVRELGGDPSGRTVRELKELADELEASEQS